MQDPTRNDYFECGRMRIYNTEVQPSHPGSEFVSQKYRFYYGNAVIRKSRNIFEGVNDRRR